MIKILFVDDEKRSEATYTIMKMEGLDIHWEKDCEKVLSEIESKEYSVIIIDVMMRSNDTQNIINNHEIPNPNGTNSGLILIKLINQKYDEIKDSIRPKIFILTALTEDKIKEYCEKNEYYKYYEKGTDNKIKMINEIKKL